MVFVRFSFCLANEGLRSLSSLHWDGGSTAKPEVGSCLVSSPIPLIDQSFQISNVRDESQQGVFIKRI